MATKTRTNEELADWHEARAAELMAKWEVAMSRADSAGAKLYGAERAIHFDTAKALRAK